MEFKKYRATRRNSELLAKALEAIYGRQEAQYGYLEHDYECWKMDNWHKMFHNVVNFKMQELEQEGY
ncbi:hypothetical protein M2139_000535 [Enterococcus sp. PF1-24]|uniref:hypothetical protein n=1 Tax=unclassified Enterococcus TaxID=2608891 RepID=UPI0024760491|nr:MULTISPECIES: hypothetical protein [unclassified Enterococcus]MDH6363698.1 hypothetical protein [Enterococcus sp. PFB1-1]MDH6400654.1 hypothetical protein [Enterococcus sp. PF1-24]